MWKAYFIETVTGKVGRRFEMSTNGRFDIRLNASDSGQVTAQKSSITDVERRWMTPWRGGILLTLTGEDGVERPITAGPITAPPEEYEMSLSFVFGGIRSVLEHRYIIPPFKAASGASDSARLSAMKKATLSFKDTSLGYIAQQVVRNGIDRTGGDLPIRFVPGPEAKITGGHDRSYRGYDIGSNLIDSVLTQLSDVSGGPDIMFRPEWTNSTHQYIRWAMHVGNHRGQSIPQDFHMVIDSTAPKSVLSELSLNTDGAHFATRAWATGAGEGAAVAMASAQNLKLLSDSHPLLESVVSSDSAKEYKTLLGHAQRAIDTRALVELHATLDGADIRTPFGIWQVGDQARLVVKGWHSVPDGPHDLRIVRAQGDLDSPFVTIYFQEDSF